MTILAARALVDTRGLWMYGLWRVAMEEMRSNPVRYLSGAAPIVVAKLADAIRTRYKGESIAAIVEALEWLVKEGSLRIEPLPEAPELPPGARDYNAGARVNTRDIYNNNVPVQEEGSSNPEGDSGDERINTISEEAPILQGKREPEIEVSCEVSPASPGGKTSDIEQREARARVAEPNHETGEGQTAEFVAFDETMEIPEAEIGRFLQTLAKKRPDTVDDVRAYMLDYLDARALRGEVVGPTTVARHIDWLRGIGEEAERFYDHFTANGWRVGGRAPMKDWKAAARNWLRNIPAYSSPSGRNDEQRPFSRQQRTGPENQRAPQRSNIDYTKPV